MSNDAVLQKYLNLFQPNDSIQVNYVWIYKGGCICAKSKTLSFVPTKAEDVPMWKCSGTASVGYKAEYNLIPVALYDDPFRRGNNKIVLCELYDIYDKPTQANCRPQCLQSLNNVAQQFDPWFGCCQTYALLDHDDHPLGWPKHGYPMIQKSSYCVGTGTVFGRAIAESHYKACLYSGVMINSENAHSIPSQWTFKIGTFKDISFGDDLWMSRFLLHRVAEDFNVKVSLDCKAIPRDHNNDSVNMTFSTKQMRDENGLIPIKIASQKLSENCFCQLKTERKGEKDKDEDECVCNAEDNALSQTLNLNGFNKHINDMVVKIPESVVEEGCGYFEYHRLRRDYDPYTVVDKLIQRLCLLN